MDSHIVEDIIAFPDSAAVGNSRNVTMSILLMTSLSTIDLTVS